MIQTHSLSCGLLSVKALNILVFKKELILLFKESTLSRKRKQLFAPTPRLSMCFFIVLFLTSGKHLVIMSVFYSKFLAKSILL